MGTYVDAAFGHCGDPVRIFEIGRALLEQDGFHPHADAGYRVFTLDELRTRWNNPSIVHNHLVLESDHFLLWLYPRGGTLHHCDVKWWALAENGTMQSGRGRDIVRTRSVEFADRFGSDRVLYIPDSIGINRLYDSVGIEEEEAYLRQAVGPPLTWDERHASEVARSGWFRDLIPRGRRSP